MAVFNEGWSTEAIFYFLPYVVSYFLYAKIKLILKMHTKSLSQWDLFVHFHARGFSYYPVRPAICSYFTLTLSFKHSHWSCRRSSCIYTWNDGVEAFLHRDQLLGRPVLVLPCLPAVTHLRCIIYSEHHLPLSRTNRLPLHSEIHETSTQLQSCCWTLRGKLK